MPMRRTQLLLKRLIVLPGSCEPLNYVAEPDTNFGVVLVLCFRICHRIKDYSVLLS